MCPERSKIALEYHSRAQNWRLQYCFNLMNDASRRQPRDTISKNFSSKAYNVIIIFVD